MKIEEDTITFSSGRTMYANCGIVGMNSEMQIYEGYDGSVLWPIPEFWKTDHPEWITPDTLTVDDMREMADHMISLWTKFKDTLK